ncbi:hypothetical protein LINPERHAP1_LOCUS24088 [Linum perenne]
MAKKQQKLRMYCLDMVDLEGLSAPTAPTCGYWDDGRVSNAVQMMKAANGDWISGTNANTTWLLQPTSTRKTCVRRHECRGPWRAQMQGRRRVQQGRRTIKRDMLYLLVC